MPALLLNHRLLFASSTITRQSTWLSTFTRFAIGGCVGIVSWGCFDTLGWLAAILVLPIVWGRSGSRWQAGAVMLSYFLASARGLPGGATVFFGTDSCWVGYSSWLVASLLTTVPYVLAWSANTGRRAVGFGLAMLVGIVPPIGVIFGVSPVTVSGVLYPGLGWVGLLMTFVALSALAAGLHAWRLFSGLLVLALVVNVMAVLVWKPVVAPAGWRGVDTHFPRLSSGGEGDAGWQLAGRQRVRLINQYAATIPANSVRVLPETILGRYDGIAQWDLQDASDALAARGSRLLVGAEVPPVDRTDRHYFNALVVLGARAGEDEKAVETVPVPVSMWKPFSGEGAAADMFGNGGRVEVDGRRVQVVICYEQLLAWSMLKGMVGRVDVLVGAANGWWARGTSIPAIQREMMRVYGRLFGVPVVMTQNL